MSAPRTNFCFFRKLLIVAPSFFIFFLWYYYSVSHVFALQPAFVKGAVFSAYDNSLIYNVTIKTSSGLTYNAPTGSFSLKLPPGVYDFICEAPGFTSNLISGIRATPGSTAIVTFRLVPSSSPTCVLQGNLYDASSFRPIPNGIVFADIGGIAMTNESGYFSMIMPSGSAVLTAGALEYTTKTTRRIDLRPGRTERIFIYLKKKNSRTILTTGIVKSQCTSEKIKSAHLVSTVSATSSDSNGTFSLPIESGPTILIASAPGYQYVARTVSFSGYIFPPVLSLNLLPSKDGFGLIVGSLINSVDGSPCDGVKIVSSTGSISFSDENGRFQIYTSTCTSYVTVVSDRFVQKDIPVSVHPGSITTVSVSLDPILNVSSSVSFEVIKNNYDTALDRSE